MFSDAERRGSQDLESSRPFLSRGSRLELGEEEDDFQPTKRSGALSFSRDRWKVIAGLLVLGSGVYLVARFASPKLIELAGLSASGSVVPVNVTSSSSVLVNANGTATFRENLLPSSKYVTAFLSAGFTNQEMEIISLIYLGLLNDRVPVVPAFLPDHFGNLETSAPTKFGDIFDVPYLSNKLGAPVVEWHELKRPINSTAEGPDPVSEQLGCWSVQAGNSVLGGYPLESNSVLLYQLDISYTPVPSKFTVTHGADPTTYIWSIQALATLGFSKWRALMLPEVSSKASALHDGSGKTLEPDEHLLCYDLLYYTGIMEPYPAKDFFLDYSPYWNRVGIHMRWKQSLVDLAEQYLRRHFNIQTSDPIPPFISVHVRHTDFLAGCNKDMSKQDCFAPISACERRVKEVRERLKTRKTSVNVQAVLVTSDERDSNWWDQVSALGSEWTWIDHAAEQTSEKYGNWFPLLLDTIFQSMGTGFVGTDRSTMSDLARKRVEDWNEGESAMVRWGGPGADNY